MKFGQILLLIAIGIVLCSSTANADEPKSITVAVPNVGNLAIQIPPKWEHAVSQLRAELPPTVKITSVPAGISLQITFIPDLEERFATKEGVERVVAQANQRYVGGSVEKRISVNPLASKVGHGCYSAFTDASLAEVAKPAVGQYRNVASGLFVVKKCAVTFTLLSNDQTSPDFHRALQIITGGISAQ